MRNLVGIMEVQSGVQDRSQKVTNTRGKRGEKVLGRKAGSNTL